jgi:hypothetical protein
MEQGIKNYLFPKTQAQGEVQTSPNVFAAPPPMPASIGGPPAAPINNAFSQARQGNAALTPQATAALGQPGSPVAPQTQAPTNEVSAGEDKWAQNIGNMHKRIEEEKEKGRGVGKAITKYGQVLQNDLEAVTINHQMNKTIASPVFQSMQRHALTGEYDYKWYSKMGTPEQKQALGDFKSNQGKLVQAATKGFGGRFLLAEMPSVERLKPQESDLIDVMIGKQHAASLVAEARYQLDSRAAQLMDEEHMPEYKAVQIASKEINWDALDDKVSNILTNAEKTAEAKLNPVTSANLNEAAMINQGGINYVPVTDGTKQLLIPEKSYPGFIAKHKSFKRMGAPGNG